MPRNFYALLVGIDNYQHVDNLNGCLRDVNAMAEYLKRVSTAAGYTLHLSLLRDSQAVKRRITDQFLNHLGKAQEEDIALFYYAGHGTREKAAQAFHESESDQLLEIIVCQDSAFNKAGMDISDKEFRYMIHKVAAKKPHLVTIFDCCFSGGSTRSIPHGMKKVPVRRLEFTKPERAWQDFIFSREIRPEHLQRASLNDLIPHGDHINLSACGRDEESNEDPTIGRGLFTSQMLALLEKENGNISYHDLIARLQIKMGAKINQLQRQNLIVVPQHPELFTHGDFAQTRFQKVFGGALITDKRDVNVSFNQTERKWQIDAGAIHGVTQGAKVQIKSQQQTFVASVQIVSPARSLIVFSGTNPPLDTILKGSVSGIAGQKTTVFLEDISSNVEELKNTFEELTDVELAETKEDASYILKEKNQTYLLHSPSHSRLLIPPISTTDNAQERLKEICSHISQWEYIRQLNSMPQNRALRNAVELQITQTNKQGLGGRYAPGRGIVKWPYKRMDQAFKIYFKVRLVNRTNKPLFCALIYVSQSFQAMPDLLEGTVKKVEPGDSRRVYAAGGQALELRADPFYVKNQWPSVTDYLKLIVSTERFNLDMFSLPGLLHSSPQGGTGNISSRSVNFREQAWDVQTLAIEQILPTA